MTTRPISPTPTELADEASAWAVGGGIITVALFPLAVPGLILLALGVFPLLLLALPAGLLLAGLALPVLLVRRVVRWALRALRHADSERGDNGSGRHAVRNRAPA